jgi:hypothetical protein
MIKKFVIVAGVFFFIPIVFLAVIKFSLFLLILETSYIKILLLIIFFAFAIIGAHVDEYFDGKKE